MQVPLYDRIGQEYNITRKADPYIVRRLYELLAPRADGKYLDIGCGTGNYTSALAEKGLALWGVEPSRQMLDKAQLEHTDRVTWLVGAAEQIPALANCFDGVLATLTMHHWTNLSHAFKELYRVVKPGSRLVLFTATPEQMAGYWLNHYFPRMLSDSIRQMPPLSQVQQALREAKWTFLSTENYSIQDNLQDLFLYAGKNRPEIYLNENVRRGISSFAALANQVEVEHGLAAVRADCASGDFIKIKKKYENALGDYTFILAEKK